jgi:NitT/TauT family transport system ATP-binding protein
MTTSPPDERTGPGDALVRVEALTVAVAGPRGTLAILDDVDLTVRPGEFVAVVGRSGCGKSTLLRCLANLLPAGVTTSPTSVVDVATQDGRRDVAWMSQRESLLPWRRAWPNALLGATVAGRDAAWAERRGRELFERFGLAGFEHAWPHELSGGMRQRLALLRTVLADRRILLLDEPFSGLDALTRRSMNAWLREIDLVAAGSRGGGGVVLVTHDVDEAALLADRVVVMSPRPGRVVADVPGRHEDPAGVRDRLLHLLGATV